MTPEEADELLESCKPQARLPQDIIERLRSDGWIFDEYYAEKQYQGFYLGIEFCIGDYCTGIYSKNSRWLLEPKKPHLDFFDVLRTITQYKLRIDGGEHWTGEED